MPLIRVIVILSLLLIIGWGYLFQLQTQQQLKVESDDPRVWQSDITTLLADQVELDPSDRILMLGDKWLLPPTLPAKAILDRRFNGAKVVDLLYFIEQLLPAQPPRAVVIALGRQDFDPALSRQQKSATEFVRLFAQVVDLIDGRWPDTPVYLVLPGSSGATERSVAEAVARQDSGITLIDDRPAGNAKAAYMHANKPLVSLASELGITRSQ